MSIETGQPQPFESPRNAKAEAKAAKAYAKAVRPWYAKKRIIIPAGLVALTIAGTALSSHSTTGAAAGAAKTSSADTGAGKAASDDAVAKVGQAVTNAGTTYEVTSVKTSDTIGDPEFLGARADGRFVIVGLALTNNKDETKTFMDANAKIKTADGKEYETSDKAVAALGDHSLMLKDIQPDLTTHGKLAFELPPSKVAGSTLEIQDLWGSGDVKVDLGL